MKDPKHYIVFPLDVPTYNRAATYVELLNEHVGLFKVGLELFIAEGPRVVQWIRDSGQAGVFLDLKMHDIPATVKRAFLAASRHGPEFVTVHCDQGEDTLRNVARDNPGNTKILAVTVLTSLNPRNLESLGYSQEYVQDLSQLVLLKAKIAMEAGCHGVVCSGHEVAMLKEELGGGLIAVTPGIRPEWAIVEGDDQKRIVTPKEAVRSGADYIVVGRPIRDSRDPVAAAKRVADEIASAL